VLRTSAPATDLDTAAVIAAYKNLAKVERDFRSLNPDPPINRLVVRVSE